MKTIYALIVDGGDGSGYLQWFKNTSTEELEVLCDKRPEVYWMNEGCYAEKLTFPLDFDLEACGFRFTDID